MKMLRALIESLTGKGLEDLIRGHGSKPAAGASAGIKIPSKEHFRHHVNKVLDHYQKSIDASSHGEERHHEQIMDHHFEVLKKHYQRAFDNDEDFADRMMDNDPDELYKHHIEPHLNK